MLAPPWIEIPPPGYGGIEQVVALLAAELTERGNEVTLFAAPGTRSRAEVLSPLESPHPDEIEMSVYEADHVASAFAGMDEADPPFDIVHDHCGFTAFAFADRIDTPLVHTLHGPFSTETSAFYARHAHKASAIALSRYQAEQAPDALDVVAVIGNPIVVGDFPFRAEKDDYLLWIGRFDDYKGAHRAIAVARDADVPLVLAGPVQPGQQEFFEREVQPYIDGDGVRYLGEVGEEKRDLFAGARALLMPIRWPEPFGLVMTEAHGLRHPCHRVPGGVGARAGDRRRDRLRRRRRGRDGGGRQAARPDRPGALSKQRGGTLRRGAGGRGVRGRLRHRREPGALTHSLTQCKKGASLRSPPEESEWRT